MAKTISAKIELDLTEFIQATKTVNEKVKQISQGFTIKPEGQAVIKTLSETFDKASKTAKDFGEQTKKSMAALIVAGKQGTTEYKALEKELIQLTAETRKFDAALEKVDAGIKKPKTGAFAGLGSELKSAIIPMVGITAGIAALTAGFSKAIEIGVQFDKTLADFSAITGQTGESLKNFGDIAVDLSKKFGGSASDQIESFKGLLSKLGPAIAESPKALESMAESINTLSKASGLDAQTSMSALANTMLQFGIDLSDPIKASEEMARIMNVMAAGAQFGAAEIPQVSEAIVVAGVAARGANLSIEETNAAIQALATGGKFGAEAGTALRNVLGGLQKQSGLGEKALRQLGTSTQELGQILTTQGLGAALDKLGGGFDSLNSDAERNVALIKLFGKENSAAAGILLKQRDAMAELTKQVTGTNTAYEQATTNMATFSEASSRLKANVESSLLGLFNTLQPTLNKLFKALETTILPAFDTIVKALTPIVNVILEVFTDVISELIPAITPLITILANLLVPIVKTLGTAIINLIKAFTPFLEMLSKQTQGFEALGFVLKLLVDIINITVIGLGEMNKVIASGIGGWLGLAGSVEKSADAKLKDTKILKDNITEQQNLIDEQKKVEASNKDLILAYGQLASKEKLEAGEKEKLQALTEKLASVYPDLISKTGDHAETLNNLSKATGISRQAMTGLDGETKKAVTTFTSLADKTGKTKEEQQKLKEAATKINEVMPGTVDLSRDYAESLGRVTTNAGLATLNMLNLNTQSAALAADMQKLIQLEAAGERDKLKKELADTFRLLGQSNEASKTVEKFYAKLTNVKDADKLAGFFDDFKKNNGEIFKQLAAGGIVARTIGANANDLELGLRKLVSSQLKYLNNSENSVQKQAEQNKLLQDFNKQIVENEEALTADTEATADNEKAKKSLSEKLSEVKAKMAELIVKGQENSDTYRSLEAEANKLNDELIKQDNAIKKVVDSLDKLQKAKEKADISQALKEVGLSYETLDKSILKVDDSAKKLRDSFKLDIAPIDFKIDSPFGDFSKELNDLNTKDIKDFNKFYDDILKISIDSSDKIKDTAGNFEYFDGLSLAAEQNFDLIIESSTKFYEGLANNLDLLGEKFGETFGMAFEKTGNFLTAAAAATGAVMKDIAIAQVELLHAPIVGLFTSIIPIPGLGTALGEAAFRIIQALLSSSLASIGFKTGGYTGDYPIDAPVGVVHGTEFVFPADKTVKYRDLFEHIHKGGDPKEFYEKELNGNISVRTSHEHEFSPLKLNGNDFEAFYKRSMNKAVVKW